MAVPNLELVGSREDQIGRPTAVIVAVISRRAWLLTFQELSKDGLFRAQCRSAGSSDEACEEELSSNHCERDCLERLKKRMEVIVLRSVADEIHN